MPSLLYFVLQKVMPYFSKLLYRIWNIWLAKSSSGNITPTFLTASRGNYTIISYSNPWGWELGGGERDRSTFSCNHTAKLKSIIEAASLLDNRVTLIVGKCLCMVPAAYNGVTSVLWFVDSCEVMTNNIIKHISCFKIMVKINKCIDKTYELVEKQEKWHNDIVHNFGWLKSLKNRLKSCSQWLYLFNKLMRKEHRIMLLALQYFNRSNTLVLDWKCPN